MAWNPGARTELGLRKGLELRPGKPLGNVLYSLVVGEWDGWFVDWTGTPKGVLFA